MKKKLLIIEDDISVAKQLKWSLGKDYDITIAGDVKRAERFLASGTFPVATLDLGLPPFPGTPEQGFELLEKMSLLAPHTRVIVITGNAEEENAREAIKLGAADFCAKPIDLPILRVILSRTFRIQELEEADRRFLLTDSQSGTLCGMIGISPAMKKVFQLIRLAGRNDYPVLITGATGTGKEMAAKAIHSLSPRADKPLVIINCGAIPEKLIESELFGHERGAFTDAVARKVGKFEQADHGTIFLDEVGDLPLPLQVKILRFLQESTVERLGGTRTITLDVRILAAAGSDLEVGVKKGTFREDLFYRLNVIQVKLPDLRSRPEDIMLLAHHFLLEESRRLGRGNTSLSPATFGPLAAHNWAGNVRELQNRIRRALGSTMDRIITPLHLGLEPPETEREMPKLNTLRMAREIAEKDAVQQALLLSGNNISQAARFLEISRPTLHGLLKKHRIEREK